MLIARYRTPWKITNSTIETLSWWGVSTSVGKRKTQPHKGVIRYVSRKTTVVPALQKARPNRTEAVHCW